MDVGTKVGSVAIVVRKDSSRKKEDAPVEHLSIWAVDAQTVVDKGAKPLKKIKPLQKKGFLLS